MRNNEKILAWKPEAKRPHGRVRHRVENIIRSHSGHAPVMGHFEHSNELSGSIKSGKFPDY
jgi:hypothetical protein